MIALAVDLCNSIAVTLFGIVLSAAFCNIHWTPKAKKRMLLYTAGIFCLAGIAYVGVDPSFGRYLYPLHTHLPLAIALCALSHERLWSFISVLTAYLCCQLRRWLALIVVAIFSGGDTMQYAVEMIVTVPLLIVLLKAAPSARCPSIRGRCSASSALCLRCTMRSTMPPAFTPTCCPPVLPWSWSSCRLCAVRLICCS